MIVRQKKGDGEFSTLIKLVLGAIVVVLAISLMWYLITGKSILESITDQYTKANITDNAYFQAQYVKLANYDEMKSKYNCVELKAKTEYLCNKNVEVDIEVGIKNTGTLAIPIYARPRVGNTCDDKAKCYGEAYLEGQRKCIIYDNKIHECTIGYKYKFDDEDTEYRIYPGAKMLKEDYLEVTKEISTTDKITYNKNNWIVLKIR